MVGWTMIDEGPMVEGKYVTNQVGLYCTRCVQQKIELAEQICTPAGRPGIMVCERGHRFRHTGIVPVWVPEPPVEGPSE